MRRQDPFPHHGDMIQVVQATDLDGKDLAVDFVRIGSTVRMAVTGELDLATTPILLERIQAIELDGPLTLVGTAAVELDLVGVDFVDSAGLTGLLRARDLLRHRGFVVRVTATSGHVDRVAGLVGLDLTG